MRVPPRSGAVVAWLDAWRSGRCGSDRAADGIVGHDVLHRVAWPGEPEPLPWPALLPRLRDGDPVRPRLALPVPGDPAGLPTVPAPALAAGEAVELGGRGLLLVPAVARADHGAVVRWDAVVTEPAFPLAVAGPVGAPGLSAADRDLRRAVLETADAMGALGLDRPRADVAARLADVERRLADQVLPATLPQRAIVVLRTAGRLLAAVTMALEDDGAAVTAGESAGRRTALQPLTAVCRRALEAAYGAGAEEAAG